MISLKEYQLSTDQGPVLKVNQDGGVVQVKDLVFGLMDGYGGSGVGDKVVNMIRKKVISFYDGVTSYADKTLPFYFSNRYLLETNCLINACLASDKEIRKHFKDHPIGSRGGASGIFVTCSDNMVSVVSTGNCLGLLIRKGNLSLLNKPDMIDFVGHDSLSSPLKTIPLSGFGLHEELHFKVSEYSFEVGDQIILLTDGVFGRVKLDEIEKIMSNQGDKLSNHIKNLFSMANQRGNQDNQSAFVLRF